MRARPSRSLAVTTVLKSVTVRSELDGIFVRIPLGFAFLPPSPQERSPARVSRRREGRLARRAGGWPRTCRTEAPDEHAPQRFLVGERLEDGGGEYRTDERLRLRRRPYSGERPGSRPSGSRRHVASVRRRHRRVEGAGAVAWSELHVADVVHRAGVQQSGGSLETL